MPPPVLPLACCPHSQSSDFSEHKCHLLIFLLCLCKGCSSDWNLLHPPCHHVLSSWFFRSHLMCVAPESPLCPFRLLHTFVSTPGLPPSQAAQLYLSLSISFLDASGEKLIFPIELRPPLKQDPRLGPPAQSERVGQSWNCILLSGSLIDQVHPVAQCIDRQHLIN